MIRRSPDRRHSRTGAKTPFVVIEPTKFEAPVVFASPHSGRFYPQDLRRQSVLDGPALRRSEDRYVDRLL